MKVNRRIALDIFWIVLGVVLIITSSAGVVNDIFSGMGGGFIVVGVIQLIRALKYKTNPEYREKIDIEINDERNRTIQMKAWSWTGYLVIIILALITIISAIFSKMMISEIAGFAVCGVLIIYWISYIILSKKY